MGDMESISRYYLSPAALEVWQRIAAIQADHIGTEHVLLGLLSEPSTAEILAQIGIDTTQLQAFLVEYIANDPHQPETFQGLTSTAWESLELAEQERLRAEHDAIEPIDLLLGMLEGKVGMAFLAMCIMLMQEKIPTEFHQRVALKAKLVAQIRALLTS